MNFDDLFTPELDLDRILFGPQEVAQVVDLDQVLFGNTAQIDLDQVLFGNTAEVDLDQALFGQANNLDVNCIAEGISVPPGSVVNINVINTPAAQELDEIEDFLHGLTYGEDGVFIYAESLSEKEVQTSAELGRIIHAHNSSDSVKSVEVIVLADDQVVGYLQSRA